MPTRTFVLEGDPKRFWDITWEGGDVEITSGVWGTDGRARQKRLASEAERDAYLATEIAKIAKKGYRECAEAAPVPAKSPGNVRKVLELRAQIEARKKPAWLPIFEVGNEGVGRVRGPMTLDPGEPWPTCQRCGHELVGLFELDLKAIPAMHLRANGLLQLFWCEAWETSVPLDPCCADPGAWLARIRPRKGVATAGPVGRSAASHAIVGWTKVEELPSGPGPLGDRFEEAEQDVIDDLLESVGGAPLQDGEEEYEAVLRGTGLAPRLEHKLAGFPAFVQGEEAGYREQIFQIERKAPFDVNFGDLGAGHLLRRADGSVFFSWASH